MQRHEIKLIVKQNFVHQVGWLITKIDILR